MNYTGNQKLFYDSVMESIAEDKSISRLRKFVLRRRMMRPRFVQLAMEEYQADLQWEDPDQPVAIDWENLDWEKLLNILLVLLKLFA